MVSDVQGLTDGTSTILVDTIKNGCRKDKVEIEEISGSEEERPSLDLDGALKRGSKIVVVMKFGNYQLSTVAEEREEQLRDNGTYYPHSYTCVAWTDMRSRCPH